MGSHEAFRRYPLFALLEPAWLTAWFSSGERLTVQTGEVLFQAGTRGRHVYLLEDGKVRVLRAAKAGEVSFGAYQPGDVFGEYALLPPGLNTATCRAAGPARLLRLPLPPLREALAGRPEVWNNLKKWLRLHALLGYRRGGLFLGFLSATSLLPLLERFAPVSFKAAHTIQADGLSADCWFVVESGSVGLHARGAEPVVLGPGDSFGERALLAGQELPVAVAHADTSCLVLAREAFLRSLSAGGGASLQTYQADLPADRRMFPWVGQQEATDCGVAALAMVARYHGLAAPVEALRASIELSPRGASLQALQRAAEGLGLRAQAARVGHDQLPAVRLPAVAHWGEGHYVVLYALSLHGALVGDPAAGVVTLSLAAVQRAWSGNVLLLAPPAGQGGSVVLGPG